MADGAGGEAVHGAFVNFNNPNRGLRGELWELSQRDARIFLKQPAAEDAARGGELTERLAALGLQEFSGNLVAIWS